MSENDLREHANRIEMDEGVWRAAVIEELQKQTNLINRNQRYVGILVLVVVAQIAAMFLCGQPLF